MTRQVIRVHAQIHQESEPGDVPEWPAVCEHCLATKHDEKLNDWLRLWNDDILRLNADEDERFCSYTCLAVHAIERALLDDNPRGFLEAETDLFDRLLG